MGDIQDWLRPLIPLVIIGAIVVIAALSATTTRSGHADRASAASGGSGTIDRVWSVRCPKPPSRLNCTVAREIFDTKSGLRLVGLEVTPAAAGALTGVLVLPFGLLLSEPVRLTVPPATRIGDFAFRTCLPSGCVVPLEIDAARVGLLLQEHVLSGRVVMETGEAANLEVPIDGLKAALDQLR